MFFLLHRQIDGGVFDDFPKITNHFPKIAKIFQSYSEGETNVPEHLPKISEDYRRLLQTFGEDPIMF